MQEEERTGPEEINRDLNKEKLVSSWESFNTLGGKPTVIYETDAKPQTQFKGVGNDIKPYIFALFFMKRDTYFTYQIQV